MITILARNNLIARGFVGHDNYKLATTASEMFGATTLYVMFDWESGKSTCDLKKMHTMLIAQILNPRCKVVRHDKL